MNLKWIEERKMRLSREKEQMLHEHLDEMFKEAEKLMLENIALKEQLESAQKQESESDVPSNDGLIEVYCFGDLEQNGLICCKDYQSLRRHTNTLGGIHVRRISPRPCETDPNTTPIFPVSMKQENK